MKRKGLTLMELLIVIGIIAVLAGLLFPIFMSVRERAWITHCINSLKQVGDALHMYSQDYDGFVPPYTNWLLVKDPKNPYLPNCNEPILLESAYEPYTKNKQIWYCPLDIYAGMDTRDGPPDFGGPPTLRATYWNELNHKATSYGIEYICCMEKFVPLHIGNIPTYAQLRLLTGKPLVGKSDEPLPYATDFYHGNLRTERIFLQLYFDGEVKVRKRTY